MIEDHRVKMKGSAQHSSLVNRTSSSVMTCRADAEVVCLFKLRNLIVGFPEYERAFAALIRTNQPWSFNTI